MDLNNLTCLPIVDLKAIEAVHAELRPVYDPRLRTFSVQLWKDGELAGIHGLAEEFRFADEPLEAIDGFLADRGARSLTQEKAVLLYAGLVHAKGGADWQHLQMQAAPRRTHQHAKAHDLIEQNSGERQARGGEEPAPGTGDTVPDRLAGIADLRGRFEDGYSADDIRSVFMRIHDAGGPYLVCVWDYADEYGFGGNSRFCAENEGGNLFEVQPSIHQWLSGELKTPGPMDTWMCAPVAEPVEIAVSDDFHNYAQADRTDD
ncbi:hypothetical protein [Streptomyces sp. NPDC053720]|uniref:hypothetical protein n=1 Tax=Streptomyces sp. NPDC053720 TaxID=3154855 RepID=UPI00342EA4C6